MGCLSTLRGPGTLDQVIPNIQQCWKSVKATLPQLVSQLFQCQGCLHASKPSVLDCCLVRNAMGMGMGLPYSCKTVPLPVGLQYWTSSQVSDHMTLLIHTNTKQRMMIGAEMAQWLIPSSHSGGHAIALRFEPWPPGEFSGYCWKTVESYTTMYGVCKCILSRPCPPNLCILLSRGERCKTTGVL